MPLIPLTQGKFAQVDEVDYPALSQYKWRYSNNGYAVRDTGEYMHRTIMNAPPGSLIDHVNGDRLNNTRVNLRFANHAQNQRNKRVQANNSTGVKGVVHRGDKYSVRIRADGRSIYLGTHTDLEATALMYDAAARRLHGEFAFLNRPDTPTPPDIALLLEQFLTGTRPPRPRKPKPPSLGKSRYRGVYSERGKWRVKISVQGRDLHIGYFDDELTAAHAYDAAAQLHHGSCAHLNFPEIRFPNSPQ